MSSVFIKNITGGSASELSFTSALGRGRFDKSYAHDLKIDNILDTAVGEFFAQELKLCSVKVNGVKATVRSSSTVGAQRAAFGFFLPDSNVKLICCKADNANTVLVPTGG